MSAKKRSGRVSTRSSLANKKVKGDLPSCPICHDVIQEDQFDAHYRMELRQLDEMEMEDAQSASDVKGKRGAAVAARKQLSSSLKRRCELSGEYDLTLNKLKRNRSERKNLLRNRSGKDDDDHLNRRTTAIFTPYVGASNHQTCPICDSILHGDIDAINIHIDGCLLQEEDPSPNVNDAHQWEGYTWADQDRVRATSLLDGGFRAFGYDIGRKDGDIDDDVDVEDVDEKKYGDAQYTEKDMIVHGDENDEDGLALREMVAGSARTNVGQRFGTRVEVGEERADTDWLTHVKLDIPNEVGRNGLVLESLKSHIKELKEIARNTPKCLICLEPYKSPLTSIVCWHVHCEECWLQTLGTKKLCPQCMKITSPADLRKIYL